MRSNAVAWSAHGTGVAGLWRALVPNLQHGWYLHPIQKVGLIGVDQCFDVAGPDNQGPVD